MRGLAELELIGGKYCKTVIKNLLVKPPLLIQKAMYLDQNYPNTAHIYIMSSACGILQDDKLIISIKASENSKGCITTQSATKIYRTENKRPNQVINIVVEKESFLEFLPKQIIPHKLAEFYQKVNIKIDQSSTLIYSENISCGRIAHGEEFDFTSLIFRTKAVNENDEELFFDAINIEPGKRKDLFKNLFGKKKIFSSTYIISKCFDNEKIDNEINLILQNDQILGGVSQLPNNAGLIIRILSDSTEEIDRSILKITDYIKKLSIIKVKH